MSARRMTRYFGMLGSDIVQYPYLTTKDSMPCNKERRLHNILVIPALVKYVRLIAVLKIEQLDFFKIQDLRAFDLGT